MYGAANKSVMRWCLTKFYQCPKKSYKQQMYMYLWWDMMIKRSNHECSKNNKQKIMSDSSQCSKLKLVERNRAQLCSRSTTLNSLNGLFQH